MMAIVSPSTFVAGYNVLPQNDRLCREAVWFTQNLLLGTRQDMDESADAVETIQESRSELTGKEPP